MTGPARISASPSWSNFTSPVNSGRNLVCNDSQDFKYLAYTVTYSLVFPVGFISNVVALFVFLCLTVKKTANTVFMTNLALSDVGFSLTLPFRLVYYFRGCQWDFSDWFCRWCVFSFYVNLYTSVLFLTGLSVLRYIAVVHPMRSKSLVTVRRAKLSCVAIWMFVACLSTPFLMSGTLVRGEKVRCFEPRNSTWERILTLNYVGISFGFVIPFVTILVCYGCIIRKLVVGPKIGTRRRNNRRRSLYLIAIVLCTFLLCFLPYHVARTVHLHVLVSRSSCRVIEVWLKILVVSLCTAASNSCFNPLLYYFAGETFRTAMRRTSDRTLSGSMNQTALYSSFRRRLVSGSWQNRARRKNFSAQTCSADSTKLDERADGWTSADKCKLSDLKRSATERL